MNSPAAKHPAPVVRDDYVAAIRTDYAALGRRHVLLAELMAELLADIDRLNAARPKEQRHADTAAMSVARATLARGAA